MRRARARAELYFHFYNIGHIGTTLHHLDDAVEDYPDDEYYDTGADDIADGYGALGWSREHRWAPVAAAGGVLVALGAIVTAVIINSGDSASIKATVGPPAPRTTVMSTTPSTAPPSIATSPSLTPQLPPETPTTVTTPSAVPSPGPTGTPRAAPPPTAVPPSATPNPRTVYYSVTGSKQLLDLVNVVYTDARGYPHTEFNVALPWTKMVVLNPGVQTESVVVTSFYSRLNCAVINAAGQTVVASANNSAIATCTR